MPCIIVKFAQSLCAQKYMCVKSMLSITLQSSYVVNWDWGNSINHAVALCDCVLTAIANVNRYIKCSDVKKRILPKQFQLRLFKRHENYVM